jgi:hypothetical protein
MPSADAIEVDHAARILRDETAWIERMPVAERG